MVAFYLAGSIQKGHEQNESEWTNAHMEHLKTGLSPHEVYFLNPAERKDDLSDALSVFGRDMTQVFLSDIVLVDARHRRGLGVGTEMLWAKLHHKPLLTWAPTDTHYHKKNSSLLGQPIADYTHPFVYSLTDLVFETLDDAIEWVKAYVNDEISQVKDLSSVQEAMYHYRQAQYSKDTPMQDLIQSCQELTARFANCI
ncbi:MAG: hypothetical protein H7A39_02610 [Chlamydiales bacterium]|nr:hypothetical protein [Chlamydiales bacterium]